MKNSLLLKNCKLYNSDKDLIDIFIEGSIISNIGKSNNLQGVETIDVKGNIIAPGLIDVHIQGAGGADVLDNSIEALETISKTLARVGTTSFIGTTVVKPSNNNEHLNRKRICWERFGGKFTWIPS
jgi:N-acetylglucosamine-6-phosphate deacetylase